MTKIKGRGGIKKHALRKALSKIPVGREFHASDVQAILKEDYRHVFSIRAIGFYLGKTDCVTRAGKNTWVKVTNQKLDKDDQDLNMIWRDRND